MQEFIDYLKKGQFRISVCTECRLKVWPPSSHCPDCLAKTSLEKIEAFGSLLEYSTSYIRGNEGTFGLVEMFGIKLVGSFRTSHLKEGMKVRMKTCGIMPDGTVFYSFVPARA